MSVTSATSRAAVPARTRPAARGENAQQSPLRARGTAGDTLSAHTLSNGGPVVVRRSARRKTGVSAFWENGQAVIAVPAALTVEDEKYWVPRMVARLERGALKELAGRRGPAGDEALMQRATALSRQYLGGRVEPHSVRWVANQNSRWGSATPARGTIRISHHVQGMPGWVLDYVLLHELAHFLHPNHGRGFWQELAGYPRLDAAKAFLDGASFASTRNITAGERSLDLDCQEGDAGSQP
ncbi:M48 family metallopeptidase [Specibacter sp. NPDC057265]|uniref:M48 metallopeptidase family protein n=1 Tax=Specibacter sp. NPDC057265 TaxID=3346075 RepID=UPI00363CAD52